MKSPAPLTILGLDPGLRITGWGIVQQQGNKLTGIATGIIKTDDKAPTPQRLATLADAITEVMKTYQPDEAAVEETFSNKNPASSLKLGLARGVVLMVPAQAGLPVGEYAANLIKKSVTGFGHADKTQMMAVIKMLLPGLKLPKADAADALAVAITHAHLRRAKARLG